MSFLRNTSIGIKVLIPPAVLILALALVSLLAVYGLNAQYVALKQANEITLNRISLLDEFMVQSERVQSTVFHISVLRFMGMPEHETEPLQEQLERGLNDLNVIYGQILTKWPLDDTERATLEQLEPSLRAFREQAQQAAVVVSDNPSFGALLVRSSNVPFTQLQNTLTQFLEYQKAEMARTEAQSNQKAQTIRMAIIAVSILLPLTAIFTTVRISNRLISQPIRTTTGLMRQLANGNHAIKISDSDRRDEIGAMARAVEIFQHNAVERARLDQALRESEQRFRELFNNMSNGVAVYQAKDEGRDFIFSDLNRASERIGQIQKDQVIGKSVLEVFPSVREVGLLDIFQQVWRTGKGTHHPAAWYQDNRVSLWVENYVYKLPSGEIVAVYNDITERKRAEEALQTYARELEQRNEEVKQFAYIVSHDLRAPLVNLQGFAAELDLAVKTILSTTQHILPQMDPQQQQSLRAVLEQDVPEALGFISASVAQLDKLISAILKLSRLGRHEIKPEHIDMEALVQDILQTLAHQIQERGAQVVIKDLPPVVADRLSLEQIMGNILTNAVLYLDSSRPGRIEISAEQDEAGTTFSIRDNGRGIAAQEIANVFAPFRRAGAPDVPGEGMGLAYVQTLVRRHHGRIWCESELGKGTTFFFTLEALNGLPG